LKEQPGLNAALIATTLCAAFNSNAAGTAEAPACTAALTNPSWSDCAGPFVLSLQGGKVFSLYDPDGATAPVAAVDFTTQGVSDDREGSSLAPSRELVHGAQMVASIPEPHTNALMLAGLAAIIAFMARRRRPR
jgi:hypothetical protein